MSKSKKPLLTVFDYDTHPGLNNSLFKHFTNGSDIFPDKFQYWLDHGKNTKTEAQLEGAVFHTVWLEEKMFSRRYVTINLADKPEKTKDFRSTENKNWKKSKEEEAAKSGRFLIDFDLKTRAYDSFDSAMRVEKVRDILTYTRNRFEEPIYWNVLYDVLGDEVPYKCRTDINSDIFICELKTTQSAAPSDFIWDFKKYAYGRQMGMQKHGDIFSGGSEKKACYVIALENEPPYSMNVYEVSSAILSKGQEQYLDAGWRLWKYLNSKKKPPTFAEQTEAYHLIDYPV